MKTEITMSPEELAAAKLEEHRRGLDRGRIQAIETLYRQMTSDTRDCIVFDDEHLKKIYWEIVEKLRK